MPKKFTQVLNKPIGEYEVRFRDHAVDRMEQNDITKKEVINALKNGEVIETYRGGYGLPAFLIGIKLPKKIHVVVGVDAKIIRIYIVTTYRPDNKRWKDGFRIRRKK